MEILEKDAYIYPSLGEYFDPTKAQRFIRFILALNLSHSQVQIPDLGNLKNILRSWKSVEGDWELYDRDYYRL